MVRGDWIKPGATVIDVGINRVSEEGKSRLVGDVNFAEDANRLSEKPLLFVNMHPVDLMDPTLVDWGGELRPLANRVVFEISDCRAFASLPQAFTRLRIAERRYLVFHHADHIGTIRGTITAIWNDYLPASGHVVADSPNFERYDQAFDPATGTGGLEIWVPITD